MLDGGDGLVVIEVVGTFLSEFVPRYMSGDVERNVSVLVFNGDYSSGRLSALRNVRCIKVFQRLYEREVFCIIEVRGNIGKELAQAYLWMSAPEGIYSLDHDTFLLVGYCTTWNDR